MRSRPYPLPRMAITHSAHRSELPTTSPWTAQPARLAPMSTLLFQAIRRDATTPSPMLRSSAGVLALWRGANLGGRKRGAGVALPTAEEGRRGVVAGQRP